MPPVDPYSSDGVQRLIWVGDLAGQDQALLRRAAQQRAAHSLIAGPTVATFEKKVVAEPFQAHERSLLLSYLELIDELVRRRLQIKLAGRCVRMGQVRLTLKLLIARGLERNEADHHLAAIGVEVAGRCVRADLPAGIHVPDSHLRAAITHGQMCKALQLRWKWQSGEACEAFSNSLLHIYNSWFSHVYITFLSRF